MRNLRVIVVAGLMLAGSAPAAAAQIAFTANSGGARQVLVVDADGSDRRPLIAAREHDRWAPAWSPDGLAIAFLASAGEDEDVSLRVAAADGSGQRVLASGRSFDRPTWSPDGRAIALASFTGRGDAGRWSVDVVETSSGARRSLVSGAAYVFGAAWSPDGRTLAYSRLAFTEGAAPTDPVLVLHDLASGVERTLGEGSDPAWSPDGGRLAFTSYRDRFGEVCFDSCSPAGEIYVMAVDGSGRRRLTRTRSNDATPAWSPDGARILFSTDQNYPAGGSDELYAIDPDGACPTQLTFGASANSAPSVRTGTQVARGPCGGRTVPYAHDVDAKASGALFWLGRGFDGMLISHAQPGLLIYGECERAVRDCTGEIQLQFYSACARHPVMYARVPRLAFVSRGMLVTHPPTSGGFDVHVGRHTIAVFGADERRMRRIVTALRGLGKSRIARPRLPRLDRLQQRSPTLRRALERLWSGRPQTLGCKG